MPFHAYILRSQSTGRYYVGHTGNLTKRIFEHNNNRTVSIKNRGPWELVHSEPFETRAEATQRERQIKKMKSRPWINPVYYDGNHVVSHQRGVASLVRRTRATS